MKYTKKDGPFLVRLKSGEPRAVSRESTTGSLAHSVYSIPYFAAATLLTVMVSPSAVPVTLAFSPANLSN